MIATFRYPLHTPLTENKHFYLELLPFPAYALGEVAGLGLPLQGGRFRCSSSSLSHGHGRLPGRRRWVQAQAEAEARRSYAV
jgi:hypothetical protein